MYGLLFVLVMVSCWDFVILVLCYGIFLVKVFYCVVEGVFICMYEWLAIL